MSGWWKRATIEDRLKQVDAAMSIGLTSKQSQIICECDSRGSFMSFCAAHGRNFQRDHAAANAKLSAINTKRVKRAQGSPETDDEGAFSVFNGGRSGVDVFGFEVIA